MDYKLKYLKYKQKYIALRESRARLDMQSNFVQSDGFKQKYIALRDSRARLDMQSNFVQSDGFKQKYMQLHNKSGGDIITRLKKKYAAFQLYCDPNGYKQRIAECWSDSVLEILCFSDEIKKIVQGKLYCLTVDEIIKLAYLEKKYLMLPSIYNNERFYTKIHKILNYLKKRFTLYYLNHVNGIPIGKENYGITCSATTLSLFYDRNKLKSMNNIVKKGGDTNESLSMLCILGIILLNEKEYLKYHYFNDKNSKIMNIELVHNCFAVQINTDTHSMSFITCNEINYFYDNVLGMVQFNWKLYFKKIMTEEYNSVLFSDEIGDNTQYTFLLKKERKLYNLVGDTLVEFTNKKAKHYKYKINEFVFIEKKKAENKLDYVRNSYEFLVYNALMNNNYDQIINYLDTHMLNINDLYYNDNNLYGFMLINNISTRDKYDIFKKYHINIETKNNLGLTVLNLATESNYIDIVKYLIENNAYIDTIDNDHMTPLVNAVYRGYEEIVTYLLSKNADCTIPDKDRKLPIDYAIEKKYKHIETLLLTYSHCK